MNKLTAFANQKKEIREMTIDEIEKIAATGHDTGKTLWESEHFSKIHETKSILKKLHLY